MIEHGGLNQIRSSLDSTNEHTRIEALAVLEAVSEYDDYNTLILRCLAIPKVITLLEEGL